MDAAAAKKSAVDFLKLKLQEIGMSQAQLAERTGLARSHVSEIMAGRLERFSVDRINRVLAVFDATIEERYTLKVPGRDGNR